MKNLKNVLLTIVATIILVFATPNTNVLASNQNGVDVGTLPSVVESVKVKDIDGMEVCEIKAIANGEEYVFYDNDVYKYNDGDDVKLVFENGVIVSTSLMSNEVYGTIVSDGVKTSLKNVNDEELYIYSVMDEDGNLIHFDTFDNSWCKGDVVGLHVNHSGVVTSVIPLS